MAGSRQQLMVRFPGNYFLLLGDCYVYCVLINVLNHIHSCVAAQRCPNVQLHTLLYQFNSLLSLLCAYRFTTILSTPFLLPPSRTAVYCINEVTIGIVHTFIPTTPCSEIKECAIHTLFPSTAKLNVIIV